MFIQESFSENESLRVTGRADGAVDAEGGEELSTELAFGDHV